MKRVLFAEEFRDEDLRQAIKRGHSVTDVAKRPGVFAQSLNKWDIEAKLTDQDKY